MMTPLSVLIVDDDPALLEALAQALRLRMGGVTVETADSAGAALDRIAVRDYDAIVTDIKMPGMDGFALLAEIRTRRPDTPTLMITAYGENDLIVGALRGGACDFIQKPIDRDYLITALHRAMETREPSRRVRERQLALERYLSELEAIVDERTRERRQTHTWRETPLSLPEGSRGPMETREASRRVRERQLALERHLSELEAIVDERTRERRQTNTVRESPLSLLEGSRGQMEKVIQQIKQVADSPLTVLVQGETGTGKELVAHAIHQLSARRDKPFVAVDCGAIPDTLIESELFGHEKGAFTGAHQRKEGQ